MFQTTFFKKLTACILAFGMLLSSSPEVWAALSRAGVLTLTLKYEQDDEGRIDVKSILTGGFANIWVTPPGQFTPGKPKALRINVKEGIVGDRDEAARSIMVADWGTGQKISVPESFSQYIADGEATLSVMGNYTAGIQDGTVSENLTGSTVPQSSDISISRKVVVSGADNTITLRCTTDETKGNHPELAVSGGTGVFEGYTSIAMKAYTQDTAPSQSALEKKELQISFTGKPLNPDGSPADNLQGSIFTIPIKQTYMEMVEDGTTKPDGTPNTVEEWNNYIKAGTTFVLSLVGPTSNELTLNVLTPERAVQNIATDIGLEKTLSQKYIKLAEGDDGDYITQPFSLNNRIAKYGEEYFNIRWKWEPADPADIGVVSITQGAGASWGAAALERKTTDVRGNLVATVYYREGKVTPEIKATTSIPILIYGTGEPARLEQWSQTIGSSSEEFFGFDTDVPDSKSMDVYDGSVSVLPQPAVPYDYRLRLFMGMYNASSQYAKVELVSGNENVVELSTAAGDAGVTFEPYTFEDEIANPRKDFPGVEGTVRLRLVAKEVGVVTFKVVYYVRSGKDQKIVPASVQPRPITVRVANTSPSSDATLSKLQLKRNSAAVSNEPVEFGFTPETKTYELSEKYSTQSIVVTPYRNDLKGSKNIQIKASRINENGAIVEVVPSYTLESGKPADPIILEPNALTKIEITVTAQNPNIQETYTLNVRREPPSDDATLKSLGFFDEAGNNRLTGFDPKIYSYNIEVPYSTKILKVNAEKNYPTAQNPVFAPELDYKNLPGIGKKEWFKLKYDKENPEESINVMKISVIPENGHEVDKVTYTVTITRIDPSEDATLQSLAVSDPKNVNVPFTPAFNKDTDLYEVSIPYSTSKLKITATPTNQFASMVVMDKATGKKLCDLEAGKASDPLNIPVTSETAPYYDIEVLTTAEDEFTTEGYVLRVTRAAPSDDATLKSLALADQDGGAIAYDFDPLTYSYTVNLPYEVEKVSVTPVTNYTAVESITVNGKKIASGSTSGLITLAYPGQSKIEVVVVAEDGKSKATYTIILVRGAPSSDARLKALVAGGTEDFKPIFIPTTLAYSAKLVTGGKAVTVTATANHPKATITINGKKVASGSASEEIEILAITEKITIVVTAQDGRTTMTYTIALTNENLMEKSSNADLRDLDINFGSMTPNFKPSIDAYQVSAKEDTHSVDILPITADRHATYQVFAGSKEIGDEDGNTSHQIYDGENNFSVKVTAQDGKKTKTYSITVYRNEEDSMGLLTPIRAETINFEANPIIVDITKYTRVSADVFNTLKEYQDKVIIFQGNDYSLQFNSSDISKIIPSTEIYDFAMSFSSPEQRRIRTKIRAKAGNDDLDTGDIVYLHFPHSGELPAPAVFNISLGRKYKNDTLYWHYYNKERDRIDYYGNVETNSKGTFALKLDHMSTYIATREHRIVGSEDKEGGGLSLTGEDTPLNEEVILDKINPGTGRREVAP